MAVTCDLCLSDQDVRVYADDTVDVACCVSCYEVLLEAWEDMLDARYGPSWRSDGMGV